MRKPREIEEEIHHAERDLRNAEKNAAKDLGPWVPQGIKNDRQHSTNKQVDRCEARLHSLKQELNAAYEELKSLPCEPSEWDVLFK